jgi:hypothetical protein
VADVECSVWKPNERSGALQSSSSRLSDELRLDRCRPRAIFEIQDIDVHVSDDGAALLNGFDIFDEGAVLSLGATFTPYHVEDYCLQNIATLQRSHKNASDACKIWFIVTDAKGQNLRRMQYRSVCVAMVESADYVLVQQEGQTIYVPPLAYHAVLTAYAASVPRDEQYALLCGTFFADLRKASLWRKSISQWARTHQTGYRHGSDDCLHEKYLKYVQDSSRSKRPSKKQKRRSKASNASKARWNK